MLSRPCQASRAGGAPSDSCAPRRPRIACCWPRGERRGSAPGAAWSVAIARARPRSAPPASRLPGSRPWRPTGWGALPRTPGWGPRGTRSPAASSSSARASSSGATSPGIGPISIPGRRLWKTQLHELPFAARPRERGARRRATPRHRARLFELVASWDASSPIGRPGFAMDCWNARAVATRLANLAVAGAVLGLRPADPERALLGALLARHALFLRDNLELDLRANHLLRDAAGLVFARELFGGFEDGLALLREQIEEQVLPDGGHIERSPLYHAIVLQDLLGAAPAAGRRGAPLARPRRAADGRLPRVPAPRRRRAAALRRQLARRARRGAAAAAVRALPEAAGGLPEPRPPSARAACWRWRAATRSSCCAPARTAPTGSSATPTATCSPSSSRAGRCAW